MLRKIVLLALLLGVCGVSASAEGGGGSAGPGGGSGFSVRTIGKVEPCLPEELKGIVLDGEVIKEINNWPELLMQQRRNKRTSKLLSGGRYLSPSRMGAFFAGPPHES